MEINEVVIFFRYFSVNKYHIRGVFTKITEKIFYRDGLGDVIQLEVNLKKAVSEPEDINKHWPTQLD